MRFNLKHFLAKRNITLLQWLNENNIKSLIEYDKFIETSEYSNDLSMRNEIQCVFLYEMLKEDWEPDTETQMENSKEDLNKLNNEKELKEIDEKPTKKKRSKSKTNDI